jgi:RNA polymerase sigma-70 factor, ECF subfamily
VIVLHHLVGLPVEEVARELRLAPGTVKSRLARGRAAMAGHPGPRPVGGDLT